MLEKLVNMFIVPFVVVDPISVTPMFGALTRGGGSAYRRRMAFKGTALAAIILLIFAFIGDWLLRARAYPSRPSRSPAAFCCSSSP